MIVHTQKVMPILLSMLVLKQMVMDPIERLRFLAPGTGAREGGEKTQPLNRFHSHRVILTFCFHHWCESQNLFVLAIRVPRCGHWHARGWARSGSQIISTRSSWGIRKTLRVNWENAMQCRGGGSLSWVEISSNLQLKPPFALARFDPRYTSFPELGISPSTMITRPTCVQ